MQHQINYQDLIDLGFKRTDLDCEVHFKKYGYHGFVLHKRIYKRLEVSWESVSHTLELRRIDSNRNILARKPITDLSELKAEMAFYGDKQVNDASVVVGNVKYTSN